jgi:hypothetical protein
VKSKFLKVYTMANKTGPIVPKIKTSDTYNQNNPYDQYKNSPLWKTIEKAIDDLVENQDLKETTSRDLIVGYLVKCIKTGK